MGFAKSRFVCSFIVAIFCFSANFAIFMVSYNKLATPFLSEEQRVENAKAIVSVIAGSFALAAILAGSLAYALLGRIRQ